MEKADLLKIRAKTLIPLRSEHKFSPTKKRENGIEYIFCPQRKRYVRLTKEELVRQQFIHFLVKDLGYSAGYIIAEYTIQKKSRLRIDIAVFLKNREPLLLIECKKNDLNIDHKTFSQLTNYNKSVKAPYIAVTNGLYYSVRKLNYETMQYQYQNFIPNYD